LPEFQKEKIKEATKIANPGCFATSIELALLPLAAKGLLNQDIHVSAITGSTGAGQSLSETSHFSWRNNNVSVYKTFTHQHLSEIRQTISGLNPAPKIHFIPYRGNFSRGIMANVYTPFSGSQEEAENMFDAFYQNSPFVFRSSQPVDVKQVVNTNKCFLHLEVHEGQLLITSVIDNLLKGASGQAVQNMNLMLGWDEDAGLRLKSGRW
jgi:N-acetyl-gamma-glutamyl-phosphate reductase